MPVITEKYSTTRQKKRVLKETHQTMGDNKVCPNQEWYSYTKLFTVYIITIYILYKLLDYIIRLPELSKKDRYILVTGCDTGFGRHLVQRLLGTDCHVIATCLTPEGVQEVGDLGQNVKVIQMDVRDPESIQRAYKTSLKFIPEDKGLWAIINNAGVFGTLGPSEWLRRSDYQHCLDINILGMIDVCNTWLPLVKKARGRVVNMSSVLGRVPVPFSSAYCMSKFAVQVYTTCLRVELAQTGVNVHLIEPGAFKTNFTNACNIKTLSQQAYERLTPQLKEEYGQQYADTMVDGGVKVLQWTMSTDERLVVDAYVHALFAKYPKRRYIIGMDSIAYILLSYLPDFVTDLTYRLSNLVPSKAKAS